MGGFISQEDSVASRKEIGFQAGRTAETPSFLAPLQVPSFALGGRAPAWWPFFRVRRRILGQTDQGSARGDGGPS